MRTIKFRAKWKSVSPGGDWNYSEPNPAVFWSMIDLRKYDKETLGEFTGLKDREGKEIWEGDIVRSSANSFKYVLKFGTYKTYEEFDGFDTHIGFYFDDGSDGFHEGAGSVEDSITYLEVLGNIYENPELLEEK